MSSLKMSGNWPLSKQLLNILDRLDDMGIAMIFINFPEMQQWDEFDFYYYWRRIIETWIGEVLMAAGLG